VHPLFFLTCKAAMHVGELKTNLLLLIIIIIKLLALFAMIGGIPM
jgi:hypothetical protein